MKEVFGKECICLTYSGTPTIVFIDSGFDTIINNIAEYLIENKIKYYSKDIKVIPKLGRKFNKKFREELNDVIMVNTL